MKRGILVLSLFLVSLLFISGCGGETIEIMDCVGEGDSIAITYDSEITCCEGLTQIPNKDPELVGGSICTGNCGDGVCDGNLESGINCADDCYSIEEELDDYHPADTYCIDENEVFICGEYIKVIPNFDSTGSYFYRSDGSEVSCPMVAPMYITQECQDISIIECQEHIC